MKTIRSLIMAMTVTGLATSAFGAEGDPEFVEVNDSILAVIAGLEKEKLVDWVHYGDLDGDGTAEAVVKTMMGPDANDPEFREWRVIDMQDGMGVQLGTWYGTDIEVVRTRTQLTGDQDISAVMSDGSLWFIYKGKMRPFGDMVAARVDTIHPGSALDTPLFDGSGVGEVYLEDMARLTMNISQHPGDEVLISLMGEHYWRGDDGATPYVLTTASGEIIHSGWSFTHPSVYKLPDGGFQLIETAGEGYRTIFFPEDPVQ